MSDQVSNNRVEREYMELMTTNGWFQLYQRLGMESESDRHQFTWNEAKKPKNKTLNRYRDVNPYDHTRVSLARLENDYINANFVTLERANRRYILTQGPLAFTTGHFWLMIWEQNSKAILMLNKIIEKNEVKCCRYWPEYVGKEEKCEDVGLNVTLIKEEDCGYYWTRVVRIFDYETKTTRDVIQYHYTTWPDFGVPSSPVAFLRFLKRVRETGVLDPTDGPPIIHCSAGIGRSGTLCLVDCCLVIVEREGIDNVDIQAMLIQMRRDRMGLIQTPDQLRFCYQAVIEGAKRLDPNWTEETVMSDSVYSFVELEETPPPPPPRAESLTRAPARPLPAIPTSTSLGNIDLSAQQESSSSDETPPTPPVRESPSPSSDDEADEPSLISTESAGDTEPLESLRKRRNRELAERVSVMKKRARETERWHSFKRSLYKPISITLGFILAGIIIYSYVKH